MEKNLKCPLTKEENIFVYSLDKILLSNKNELTPDTFSNMNEPQEYYAEWNFWVIGENNMLILKEIAKFFSKVVVPFHFLTNKI